ncbi:hypothetical protein [Arthrobacter sp.]|uniref:hypothetical protein n=1 Tax=Arthrobacter sp. TaxID=1667 RepID=UPI003A9324AC
MSEQHPNQPPSGYPYPGQPGWNQQPPAATGMTKAAMIIGIVAVALSFIPVIGFVSFILGAIAVVLGIIALVKKLPRKGFALTGLITGAVALIVCVVYIFVLVAVANVVKEGAGSTAQYTYSVTGEGGYTVTYLTQDIDQVATEDIKGGTFTKDVTASTLLGLVTATNAKGNTGALTCKVTDAQDKVVSTNSSKGPAAQVTCPVVEGISK